MSYFDGFDSGMDNTKIHFSIIQSGIGFCSNFNQDWEVIDLSWKGKYNASQPDMEVYYKGELVCYIEADEQKDTSKDFMQGIPARKKKLSERKYPETPIVMMTFKNNYSLCRVDNFAWYDLNTDHKHKKNSGGYVLDRNNNPLLFIHIDDKFRDRTKSDDTNKMLKRLFSFLNKRVNENELNKET